jgi:hypothetical protein
MFVKRSSIKISVTSCLILILSGCIATANMVKNPNESNSQSKYAPDSEKKSNGVGVVSYMNEGIISIRETRREDAYKKMYGACNGKYEIFDERSDYTDPMYVTQKSPNLKNTYNTYSLQSEYRYFYFVCK